MKVFLGIHNTCTVHFCFSFPLFPYPWTFSSQERKKNLLGCLNEKLEFVCILVKCGNFLNSWSSFSLNVKLLQENDQTNLGNLKKGPETEIEIKSRKFHPFWRIIEKMFQLHSEITSNKTAEKNEKYEEECIKWGEGFLGWKNCKIIPKFSHSFFLPFF